MAAAIDELMSLYSRITAAVSRLRGKHSVQPELQTPAVPIIGCFWSDMKLLRVTRILHTIPKTESNCTHSITKKRAFYNAR